MEAVKANNMTSEGSTATFQEKSRQQGGLLQAIVVEEKEITHAKKCTPGTREPHATIVPAVAMHVAGLGTKSQDIGKVTAHKLYVEDHEAIVQAGDPTLTKKEVNNILRVQWKQISVEEKRVFRDRANEKNRVLILPKACKPKGPRSGYIIFSCEQRQMIKAQYPEFSNKEVVSHMGKLWRDLPVSEKSKFNAMASVEKSEYIAKNGPPVRKKRIRSAYSYFGLEVRPLLKKAHPSIELVELNAEQRKLWKETSEHERARFKDMANQVNNETEGHQIRNDHESTNTRIRTDCVG